VWGGAGLIYTSGPYSCTSVTLRRYPLQQYTVATVAAPTIEARPTPKLLLFLFSRTIDRFPTTVSVADAVKSPARRRDEYFTRTAANRTPNVSQYPARDGHRRSPLQILRRHPVVSRMFRNSLVREINVYYGSIVCRHKHARITRELQLSRNCTFDNIITLIDFPRARWYITIHVTPRKLRPIFAHTLSARYDIS